MDLSQLRESYSNERLKEPLPDSPWSLVTAWFQEAVEHGGVKEPNAMSLATADENGQPSVRLVLAKEIRDEGVVFFTNYDSKKGRDIAVNPKVAVTIWWPELERQVRILGRAEKIPPKTRQHILSPVRAAHRLARSYRPRVSPFRAPPICKKK